MIFMTYWFAAYAAIFFPLYWLARWPLLRLIILLVACATFHAHFAGPAGVLPIVVLAIATYLAGLTGSRAVITGVVIVNTLALVFYKYLLFLSAAILVHFSGSFETAVTDYLKQDLLPAAPPLAISFFIFEFVHYLIDVARGHAAIRSPMKFSLFAIYWPSIVAGPVKRYEQFLPELTRAASERIDRQDFAFGLMRVSVGFLKKCVADNITAMLAVYDGNYDTFSLENRWIFFVALAFRILLDFSGYSDMAIGFARMMGIRLPENFNWPYLATSPVDFWRRWHISLSTWIRDYIYIPLGGGRHGNLRRVVNALIAFALCGLWHGAGWNFAIWGIYHGVGVAATTAVIQLVERLRLPALLTTSFVPITWACTMLFVGIGWLFFFYSVDRAIVMIQLLFRN